MRNRILFICTFFVVLYFAAAPIISWPIYSLLLFTPAQTKHTEGAWNLIFKQFPVTKEVVQIQHNDGVIYGWLFTLKNSKNLFLVNQGKGANLHNRAGMVQMLLRCGGSVFIYNYRGFGESKGVASLKSVCEDAVICFDYLKKKVSPDTRIIVYGESFGSGVTGQLVKQRKSDAVIIQSGFTSLSRASRDIFFWLNFYPRFLFPEQLMDNEAVFAKPHAPLLIIHGEKDNLVLCQNAKDLYASSVEPKELLLLPNGTHGSFGTGDDYFRVVEKFLENLKPRNAASI